jgi:trehalose synthase
VIGPRRMRELDETIRAAAGVLGSRTVVNVNSTAAGGGVAELLETLLGYARGARIATRWFVLEGDAAFFEITKRIHNGMYGAEGTVGPLGAAEDAAYRRTLDRNAGEIDGRVAPGDIVILHDPQTAGLVPAFRRLGATIVWRCHVGSDRANEWTERAWAFLRPHVESVDAYVFSSRRFVPGWIDPARIHVITPSIDPFSLKNMHLTRSGVRGLVAAAGLIQGSPRATPVRFPRGDESRGSVEHRATVVREGAAPAADAPLVVQISRWDRMKDMAGVMTGFAEAFDPSLGAHLVLAGPEVDSVADDPEAGVVFAECRDLWESLPPPVRRNVHLACLPIADHDENAAITNALQRHATIVCQKSLAEGFGLTVTEAMWKGRPVVASAVGGIVDQIRGPDYGVLIDDPTDLSGFAAAVDHLLRTPAEARRIGTNARRFTTRHLLTDRHLQRYAELIGTLPVAPA